VSELTPAEVAHVVAHEQHGNRREGLLEITEAILLAVVAIATAWSGYQTGKWDGHQASLYSLANKYRVEADTANTLSGQQRLYDTTTFGFWLDAKARGDEADAKLFERRFRPEYRPAFKAWIALDPLNNPKAPPGPIFMPQYRNAQAELATAKEHQASEAFEEGTQAREQGDKYLRNTVLLATVLFLTALAQKFRLHSVRLGLLVLCGVLLSIALVFIITYPRI
jgi:CHASE1-domain containing sensor protein